MKIVKAGYEILTPIDGKSILKHIERCGRVCYKSEDNIVDGSAEKFVRMLVKRGHESVLEHFSISVLFTVDRGVSHELVRHRLASYSQESTRYCNYGKSKEVTFVEPSFFSSPYKYQNKEAYSRYVVWQSVCEDSENYYLELLERGATPQEARAVLPNSLKTEIVMTANLREWRTVFKQRCAKDAHPQMREVMIPLLNELAERIPVVFDDITKGLIPWKGALIVDKN